ncbi:MAG: YceI family protein [Desulfomonile sp.]|jgi:polyisoprenoid-binding protein YceI
MKLITTVISTIIAIAIPIASSASSWIIDPDHSNAGFTIRHMMVGNVQGCFQKMSGTVEINDQDITKSSVDVSIDAGSIYTKVEKRDEHLRSADFFDVAKYPTITFVSKKVEKSGEDRLEVTGDLNLHGVTRQIVLDVKGPTNEIRDLLGHMRRGASAVTQINRTDFGINWNKTLEAGGVAVGEEVMIGLEIEMIRK